MWQFILCTILFLQVRDDLYMAYYDTTYYMTTSRFCRHSEIKLKTIKSEIYGNTYTGVSASAHNEIDT